MVHQVGITDAAVHDHLVQRHPVEDIGGGVADLGHGDAHRAGFEIGAVFAGKIGALACTIDRRQRPVQRSDDMADVDVLGPPGQTVAAAGPLLRSHHAGILQFQKYGVEELLGNAVGERDFRAAAYSAGAIALHAAGSLQCTFDARFAGDDAAEEAANAIAELETAQAQSVVTRLVLDASTLLFDALGASATRKPLGLDRHWRNARTLSSHNPRIYKDRIIGDFAVNGTLPPYQWRIGQAPETVRRAAK